MTDGGKAVARVALLASLLLPSALPSPLPAQGGALSRRLDTRLDAAPFNRHLWGVALVDEKGKLVYGRNADRMFIPASNTKIVVAAVASALFSPDFTVKTSVYAAGPVVNGVVQGDLVLYGRGDPTFGRRCFATDTLRVGVCDRDPAGRMRALADTLAARGITSVDGDVVGDGSYFDGALVHPGWEAYDLNWWYAAPVSGLGFNDNAIDITYAPGSREGEPATIGFTPDFGDVTLENRTRTVPAGAEETIDFFREPGTLHVWAEGTVQLGGRTRTEYFALPDPNLYAARALRAALAARGISVAGATRSTTDSTLYQVVRRAPALADVNGRPMRDWIFPILNTSQNWYAEMVLKQLGKAYGGAGSWDEGIKVERRFLIDSVGIDSTQFALSDGSGLSASNLMSPLAFTQLLRFIRRHPHWETFAAGLPQSGNTGSLRNRFRGTPLEGKVRAKTGSISRVNTLSGYVELDGGKGLVFSVQANHHTQPTRAILAQIDSVVVDMARGR
ncbi:MAG TPA: D-alanyl-D-alanine carboxypeptidase/D-alanyl-D-alanine-endopeptidase [Gemmatimonadales bacterium]|nr:D-alanyl-D-alanine carboxypeptidase/D-alanyl-D-alanine-endopeptidase [Gemmatimonadales bacterium]